MLDTILTEKLDLYCPVKVKRLSSHDKPFITPEIKNIDRRRNREYARRGKTLKYFELKKMFELKYRAAAKRYLKNRIVRYHENGTSFPGPEKSWSATWRIYG